MYLMWSFSLGNVSLILFRLFSDLLVVATCIDQVNNAHWQWLGGG